MEMAPGEMTFGEMASGAEFHQTSRAMVYSPALWRKGSVAS